MNKIYHILICIVTIFFSSCQEELEDVNFTTGSGQLLNVNLTLNTPSSFIPQSRNLTESQESEINDAYIFAFSMGTLSYVKNGELINNGRTLKAVLKASRHAGDTYKLMIIANASETLTPFLGPQLDGLNGKTYNEIQELLNKSNLNQPLFTSGGSIIMWGELPYQEIKNTNNNFTIHLMRSIARIDIGVGATSYNPVTMQANWGGLPNFTLEEVYVYKPNNAYSFIPAPVNFDETNMLVTKPSALGIQSSSPFTYTVTNGISSVRKIYVPEADIKRGSGATSGDANHTNRMAIVVKGSYNGNASSYYRLDFINQSNELTNVLRNYFYQFNIKSVSGNGYNNPDEAYNALSDNISVEVLQWNDGAISDIIFNGQYHFGVSQSKFFLKKEQQTITGKNNQLTVTTDYPNGWIIEKIVGEDGSTTSASWITASRYSGPANSQTTLAILTDANNSGMERKAFIHFRAGRLEYIVEVTQSTIPEIIPLKRLLTIGSSADLYGYNFSGTAASNKLITSIINFGSAQQSVVRAEGFTIINGGQNPTDAQLLGWLITNPVDIVIIGYDNFNITTTIANYYAQFLANKGTLLAFQDRIDNGVSGYLLKAILNSNVTISYAEGPGAVYQFKNIDNEVLNGPFGDIRGKQWGEDASTTVKISGITPGLVDILSDDNDISTTGINGNGSVTAFIHKSLNFIWVGDGGFNSSTSGTEPTIAPFRLDKNNSPIPKPGYGRGTTKYSVYNSTFTANAIAWGLNQSERK